MRRICFITGTRADYGIMSSLMQLVRDSGEAELQIIATNMHLSDRHGLTVREIESDGLVVSEKVAMPCGDGSARRTVEAMGAEMTGMGAALSRLEPDMIVLLGDRYEMLVAASAALIFGIPVAHLYGGETTEGAYDDSIRHAITKLSRLHFTSTEEYRRRIIAMGESPATVHWVGALGADNISRFDPWPLGRIEASLGAEIGEGFILATFHPVTLEPGEEQVQTEALLNALEPYLERRRVLFTMPNADTGGALVARLIEEWACSHPGRVITCISLGRARYYSAVARCAAVVGNSSSGLTEAPSWGVPTLDIGNRQKGRAAGPTVVHCGPRTEEIAEGLAKVLDPEFAAGCRRNPVNPYARPGTLGRIADVLLHTPLPMPAFKPFHDI